MPPVATAASASGVGVGVDPPADQEYTYDKAIEDYVRFTNAALSKPDASDAKTR